MRKSQSPSEIQSNKEKAKVKMRMREKTRIVMPGELIQEEIQSELDKNNLNAAFSLIKRALVMVPPYLTAEELGLRYADLAALAVKLNNIPEMMDVLHAIESWIGMRQQDLKRSKHDEKEEKGLNKLKKNCGEIYCRCAVAGEDMQRLYRINPGLYLLKAWKTGYSEEEVINWAIKNEIHVVSSTAPTKEEEAFRAKIEERRKQKVEGSSRVAIAQNKVSIGSIVSLAPPAGLPKIKVCEDKKETAPLPATKLTLPPSVTVRSISACASGAFFGSSATAAPLAAALVAPAEPLPLPSQLPRTHPKPKEDKEGRRSSEVAILIEQAEQDKNKRLQKEEQNRADQAIVPGSVFLPSVPRPLSHAFIAAQPETILSQVGFFGGSSRGLAAAQGWGDWHPAPASVGSADIWNWAVFLPSSSL